jgi:hypothetical protein
VYFVRIEPKVITRDYKGCIGHPNAKGQAKMAEIIYEKVKKILQTFD